MYTYVYITLKNNRTK